MRAIGQGNPFIDKIADDFLFGRVVQDNELCRQVLETLLGHEIGPLTTPENEKSIRITRDNKRIRSLYTFMQNGISTDELTDAIARKITIYRDSEQWRNEYMKELLNGNTDKQRLYMKKLI